MTGVALSQAEPLIQTQSQKEDRAAVERVLQLLGTEESLLNYINSPFGAVMDARVINEDRMPRIAEMRINVASNELQYLEMNSRHQHLAEIQNRLQEERRQYLLDMPELASEIQVTRPMLKQCSHNVMLQPVPADSFWHLPCSAYIMGSSDSLQHVPFCAQGAFSIKTSCGLAADNVAA